MNEVVLIHLLGLAADRSASIVVRFVASDEIEKLKSAFTSSPRARQLIETFGRDPTQLQLLRPIEPPPGQPIGEDPDFTF
ncbi:MAG: hypothetical protein M3Y24_00070 [Acidobacteriota bacterium]|nr:hypothetical protein [Acidobacteriota bacterium]